MEEVEEEAEKAKGEEKWEFENMEEVEEEADFEEGVKEEVQGKEEKE